MGESQGSSLEHSLPRIDSVVFRMADSLFKLFDMMVHLQSPDEIWQRAAAADAADAEGAAAETAVDSDEAMAGIRLDGSVDAMADVSGLGAGHADEHVAERAAEHWQELHPLFVGFGQQVCVGFGQQVCADRPACHSCPLMAARVCPQIGNLDV